MSMRVDPLSAWLQGLRGLPLAQGFAGVLSRRGRKEEAGLGWTGLSFPGPGWVPGAAQRCYCSGWQVAGQLPEPEPRVHVRAGG